MKKNALECPPASRLPGWMATFSDLVTLLLTFFVLLLSFAKTESAKYEAALGSIRNAFGGNVLRQGEVIERGKSPDDNPTILESQEPIRPFPIDFLTMEGILDKHEINRESEESLDQMKKDLKDFELDEDVNLYEMPEGIRVQVKNKIEFKEGTLVPAKVIKEVYDSLVKMVSQKDWTLYVMGHASVGETGPNGQNAFDLSAARAKMISKGLIKRGVLPEKIITSFYGDSLAKKFSQNPSQYRHVEFMIRKVDTSQGGRQVRIR